MPDGTQNPTRFGKTDRSVSAVLWIFLFDPEIARLQNLEEDSKEDNPYLKSSIHLFLENLKRTLLNFKSRFKNPHLLYQTPGKKLARNFLLLLLAIGIVRTCFFLRLRICKIQIRFQIPGNSTSRNSTGRTTYSQVWNLIRLTFESTHL